MTANAWPADSVARRPIAELVPYARNARTHSPEQVAALAASLKQWGWTNPVLVDEDGGIIAGHGRVMAAQALGMAEVPVMVAAGWTEAQKRAYVIADNQLAIGGAEWDAELLAVELDELRDLRFDLPLIGFSPGELNDLIGTPNTGFDPDEVPPAPVVPVSRTGDLWLLGRHRLLCGDATNRHRQPKIRQARWRRRSDAIRRDAQYRKHRWRESLRKDRRETDRRARICADNRRRQTVRSGPAVGACHQADYLRGELLRVETTGRQGVDRVGQGRLRELFSGRVGVDFARRPPVDVSPHVEWLEA